MRWPDLVILSEGSNGKSNVHIPSANMQSSAESAPLPPDSESLVDALHDVPQAGG
jgi:hypothetical protein